MLALRGAAGAPISLRYQAVGSFVFGGWSRSGDGPFRTMDIVGVLELHWGGPASRDGNLLEHLSQRIGFEYWESPHSSPCREPQPSSEDPPPLITCSKGIVNDLQTKLRHYVKTVRDRERSLPRGTARGPLCTPRESPNAP